MGLADKLRHFAVHFQPVHMISPLGIERICLREFRYFIRRHRRYLITFLAIYGYSLFAWRRLRLLRAGHCLAQHVDDVLDGDRAVGIPPLNYLDELIGKIEANHFDFASDIPALAGFVFGEADRRLRPGCDIRTEFLALFKTLRADRVRFESQSLLTKEQLDALHRATFTHSMDVSLMMVDSPLRAADIPEMVGALSWVSPMRDLREDLQRGLVNVPLEVIEAAREAGATSLAYDALMATRAVRAWVRAEFQRGEACLQAIPPRLRQLFPRRGVLEIWAFYVEIARYAVRYKTRYHGICNWGLDTPEALVE